MTDSCFQVQVSTGMTVAWTEFTFFYVFQCWNYIILDKFLIVEFAFLKSYCFKIIIQIYVKFRCPLTISAFLWSDCIVFLNSHCKKGHWLENCVFRKTKYIWRTAFDLIVRLFYFATEKYVILIIWDCQVEAYFKANL